MQIFKKTLAASLFAAAFTMAAPQVFAASVNLTQSGGLGVAPEMVLRTPDGTKEVMWVGGYKEVVNAVSGTSLFTVGQDIITWCIDVALHKAGTGNYEVNEVTGATTPSWVSAMEQLFTRFGSSVGDAVSSAAMQLAVWEVVGGDTTLNLDHGNFQASPVATPSGDTDIDNNAAASQDAYDMAQGWLNTLNNSAPVWSDYRIVTLSYGGDGDKQSLLTVIPTPLPGAALMFLSALGLGGLARRKSKADPEALAA